MGIASRKGFRSILSRTSSPYSHLCEDENDFGITQKTPRPVTVSDGDCGNDVDSTTIYYDNFAVCISSSNTKSDSNGDSNGDSDNAQEEEKVSEEYYSIDFFETAREASTKMVRSASSMTDTMTKTKASKSISWAVLPGCNHGNIGRSAKSDDTNDINTNKGLHRTVERAYQCGNSIVETSKECVDTTLQKSYKAANDLVQISTSLGKEVMASAEVCSQSAIIDHSLSPMLEQTSEQLETAFVFLIDHWALWMVHLTNKRISLCSTRSSENVHVHAHATEDTVLNVSVEIQIKATE